MNVATEHLWLNDFPELAAIVEPHWRQQARQVHRLRVPAGTLLFRDGDRCQGYVFVVSGSVRVQKIDLQGREIVLYRVERGQTCMLTTACLIGNQLYPAEGVAESEVELAMFTPAQFEQAIAESAGFRRYVLAAMGQRIADLMLLVEDVAFGRMDVRLARLLLKRGGEAISATHQELATELGTAREVVSRLLKDFERKGWVELGRGQIALRRPQELVALHEE